ASATDCTALQLVADLTVCRQRVKGEPLQSIADLQKADERAAIYLTASLSASTKRAYSSDLAHFLAWGGTIPADPELVARYLALHGENLSPFTLARRLIAIGKAHGAQNLANPCDNELVRSVLRGIRRVHGSAQRQVDPLLKEDVLAVIDALPPTLKGTRDRALLLVGFAAALRRSELVGLNVEDVKFVPEGLILRLRRSKTDQEGEGRDIGIPYARSRACPVKALRAWLDQAGITAGPIFRGVGKSGHIQPSRMTSQSVALVIKHNAAKVGLDPERFSGHSLRAGLITSAAKLGVSTYKIRQQSGHRSEATLTKYIRDGELFLMNAAGAVL
ncbi:MAG: tyrosine-type recombinase/integrase, partial [Nevskia sp.]|nr:tyrosine-type recombinase/integrase [Nevskia sp.]